MHRSTPIGYNSAMKLQFSLATLLVCVTVLAVVCWFSMMIPVKGEALVSSGPDPFGIEVMFPYSRMPQFADIAVRLALWGPLAIAATLGVQSTIRRLKSRRHTKTPVA